MKKDLLIFLLVCAYFTHRAQYRKLPLDTNHYWQQSYSAPHYSVFCDYVLKVLKDSVVNGKTFQLVGSVNVGCSPPSQANMFYDAALLRNDTILKLVTYIYFGDPDKHERILYNFNKNVGDTADLLSLNGRATYTLQAKDSVLLEDGFHHRRFKYGNAAEVIPDIIEGVGCTAGLLTPRSPFEQLWAISCLSRKTPGLTIYSSMGPGSACPVIHNSVLEYRSENSSIKLFPNPAFKSLSITATDGSFSSIEILTGLGAMVRSLNSISSSTTIDVGDLEPGIYFVKVQSGGKITSGRFIKD